MAQQQDFASFAVVRIVLGILIAAGVLWIAVTAVNRLDKPAVVVSRHASERQSVDDDTHTGSTGESLEPAVSNQPAATGKPAPPSSSPDARSSDGTVAVADSHRSAVSVESKHVPVTPVKRAEIEHPIPQRQTGAESTPDATQQDGGGHPVPKKRFSVRGMAFVDAMIQPMSYELNERFWGWRPNDILNVTDNVNNFQLGVLEVTRRTTVSLAERISRTGSTEAFDQNLENAMNWFMIKADKYWFPSAESKYKAGLDELKTYFEKLEQGAATFYSRTDNLIPLLMAYQDLLGSCDENLVKKKEKAGSPVSHFKADDYFYYAQGVASTMGAILEAIGEDFHITIENRHGTEVLHHAIQSCHMATTIDPWLITNSNPGSVFANHRANLAAPISHARFYIGVLIKTLST